jgi:2-oxoacid:acceptor oxidoreductase delta subunit (pyruvate/2-ketoisovalerate family)
METGATIKHDINKAPKTGSWGLESPGVDGDKCIGCGTCVPFCPEAAIELRAKDKASSKKIAAIDYVFCKGCGVCADVCPIKAIKMNKKS